MVEEEETCNLFETSNEIEAVFGPQDQVKRMTTELVKAVNTAPFCALGRFCAKEEMKKRAACRLAAMNYVITNPEIQSVKITAPLIVIGHPRSGTTLIQRLLACDPKARGFKMFEMTPALGSYIVPPPNEDNWGTHQNIARNHKSFKDTSFLFPEFFANVYESHYTASEEYEEEVMLMSHQQFDFPSIVNNPDVLALHKNQEYMVQVYIYMKRFLQILLFIATLLQALFSVFPDARVVQMHRDVTKVVPSCALTISRMESYKIADGVIDAQEYGKAILQRMVQMTQSVKKFRSLVNNGQVKLIPSVAADENLKKHIVKPEQFLDVDYDDLVSDPVATVRSIYKHYSMTITPEFEDAMKLYMLENPQGKYTKSKVDAKAMFGFTDESIRAAFGQM
ncbi:hypothetical protein HDU79_005885 [Rhizoclosmatium sp. JEL0117]|nr:hypothetical protein HDU79_005885 [Rhizoclosmatium sp. JEL0117]